MVVLAGAVVDLSARVAAFDLDRCMPDGESFAQSSLQVANDVLSLAKWAVVDHHVDA